MTKIDKLAQMMKQLPEVKQEMVVCFTQGVARAQGVAVTKGSDKEQSA